MTDRQSTIFIVDDNNTNLIACKNILKPHYLVYPAQSGTKMFELLEHVTPDLILLDVEMLDMDGYDTARKLKSSDKYKNIPIIFLTARSDATSEMEGLSLGAVDYIHKPFFSALLLKRIEMHLALINNKVAIEEQGNKIKEMQLILQNEILAQLNSIIESLDTSINENNQEKIKTCDSSTVNTLKNITGIINSMIGISNENKEQ